MFHQLKVCLIVMKNALHLFHLQARKFSMQILFREHDVTGEIIFIISNFSDSLVVLHVFGKSLILA